MRYLLIVAALVGLAAPAHAWVYTRPYDLTSVSYSSDAVVVARPLGHSRWQVTRRLKGPLAVGQEFLLATAWYEIGDAEQALVAMVPDGARKVWYPTPNGVQIVARGITYDFVALDARFNGAAKLEPGDAIIDHASRTWWARSELKRPFAVQVTLAEQAIARAREAAAAFAEPPGAARRERLLSLYRAIHTGDECPEWYEDDRHLDTMIVNDIAKANDLTGSLAIVRISNLDVQKCRGVISDALQVGALTTSAPEDQRALALRRGGFAVSFMTSFFNDPSLAVRLEASAQIAAFPCHDKWNRKIFADAAKLESDPAVRANLERGAAKICRGR